MPVLATVGTRLSELLHHLVFALPSPTNGTFSHFHNPFALGKEDLGGGAELPSELDDSAEARALAGGIGPLSFAGSGYGVLLVLTGILLNRIHHIVRRPRPPQPPQPHPPITSPYWRARTAVARWMTSPGMSWYLRLPGVFVMTRAWVMFTILVLQVAEFWPVEGQRLYHGMLGGLVNKVGAWVGDMEMGQVCWEVFMSVCLGLVCTGLANGLDRTRRRDPAEGFNLIGYAFLLHLYSSPLTHHRPPPFSSHSRPDVHALFQLWLGLTEVTLGDGMSFEADDQLAWLQSIELSETVRRNQLLPTGVCGLMGLAHFVYGLSTSPLKFPSFTFLTHLMALVLVVIITMSMFVKAFTLLCTDGYLPSPVLANLLPHEGVIPSIEDDFGVTLLKIGIACIEQTQYSGLRNELARIEEPKGPWLEMSPIGSSVVGRGMPRGGFSTELTQIEVTRLDSPQRENEYRKHLRRFWRACLDASIGFLWHVILSTPLSRKVFEWTRDYWQRRWWYGPRSWRVWRRDAWAEPAHFRRQTIMRAMDDYVRRQERQQHRYDRQRFLPSSRAAGSADTQGVSSAIELRESARDPSAHLRFLRGETELSDGEDADFDGSSPGLDNDWTDEEDDDIEDQHDIVSYTGHDDAEDHSLYQDFSTNPDFEDSSLLPVLLAHLTSRASTPMTRRQYALLASPSRPLSPPTAFSQVVAERRQAMASKEAEEWDEDRRRSCVVCTVEPRDTILWPCRCLAVCNDCRENLASRLAAKDHLCPCCRRKIEGYSRIYVP